MHSRWGEMIVRVRTNSEQQPGGVFVPMHWGTPLALRGGQRGGQSGGRSAVRSTGIQSIPGAGTGVPSPLARVFAIARHHPPAVEYRVSVRDRDCWRYELAEKSRSGIGRAGHAVYSAMNPLGNGWSSPTSVPVATGGGAGGRTAACLSVCRARPRIAAAGLAGGIVRRWIRGGLHRTRQFAGRTTRATARQ